MAAARSTARGPIDPISRAAVARRPAVAFFTTRISGPASRDWLTGSVSSCWPPCPCSRRRLDGAQLRPRIRSEPLERALAEAIVDERLDVHPRGNGPKVGVERFLVGQIG